jgi:hypothetical protein
MDQLKNTIQGFFVSTSVICLFITFGWLPYYIDLWVVLALSLFLAIPLLIRGIIFLRRCKKKMPFHNLVLETKNVILFVQGIALACWFFDICTTFFSIDLRGDVEINPLGWPFGIIGAAVYYIPALAGVYYLLYKTKSNSPSFFVAIIVTALTLFMGSLNFNAGMLNFANLRLFTNLASNSEVMAVWLLACAALAIMNIIVILKPKNNRLKQANFN